jgi:DNA mismatch endonuclease, patch repair protein
VERWVKTGASSSLSGRRSRDTGPEVRLRKALHRLGLRFRLHRRIAGTRLTVDIVLARHRLAVFVDGDYWHGTCPEHPRTPTRGPNRDAWEAKFARIAANDQRAADLLAAEGYRVLRFRECQVDRDPEAIAGYIQHEVSLAH